MTALNCQQRGTQFVHQRYPSVGRVQVGGGGGEGRWGGRSATEVEGSGVGSGVGCGRWGGGGNLLCELKRV